MALLTQGMTVLTLVIALLTLVMTKTDTTKAMFSLKMTKAVGRKNEIKQNRREKKTACCDEKKER